MPKLSSVEDLASWEPSIVFADRGSHDNNGRWNIISQKNRFSIASLEAICTTYNVSIIDTLQGLWALVISTFSNNDEICSGFISDSVATIYHCKLETSVPVANVGNAIDTWDPSILHFPEKEDQSSNYTVTLVNLFDTALEISLVFTGSSSLKKAPLPLINPLKLYASISLSDNTISTFYQSALVSHFQAENIALTFQKVIESFFQTPGIPIKDLDLISYHGRATILQWNKALLPSIHACIHEIIHQHSLAHPHALAISSWDGQFSYQELDRVSTCLAAQLKSYGVKEEVIVPFCFNKSRWAIVAMLATLKAGGASVALSPEYPNDRISHIVHLTNASLVLSDSENADHVGDSAAEVAVVVVDEDLISRLQEPREASGSPCTPSNAAFIQFTSGTTGNPKGIVLEHGAFLTSMVAQHRDMHIHKHSRVLQFAAYTFDASLQEIFGALTAGGCVCIPSEHQRLNNIGETIKRMQASWVFMTPLFAKTIHPSDVVSVETMVIGGEVTPKSVINDFAPKLRLLNGYGPSECSIASSVNNFSMAANPDAENIGNPMQSCNFWVVSPRNPDRLAPVGAIGELVIQGPILAREYLKNVDATKRSFQSPAWLDSFSAMHPKRVYNTGDLVRYQSDGSLQFVGRNDSQVKVTGRRVDLKETEFHLSCNLPDEMAAAVNFLPLQTGDGEKKALVAFYWPKKLVDGPATKISVEVLPVSLDRRELAQGLSQQLKQALPSYMIPNFYIPLSTIPLTLSGKLDHRQLKSLFVGLSNAELGAYSPATIVKEKPQNKIEEVLRSFWAEVLGLDLETIGTNDNFFELGGESIAAIRLSTIAHANGLHLTTSDILSCPEFKLQAQILYDRSENQDEPSGNKSPLLFDDEGYISATVSKGNSHQTPSWSRLCEKISNEWRLDQTSILDIYPCSPMQKGLLALTTRESKTKTLQKIYSLSKKIDIARFQYAWERIVAQNDIFRTRIVFTSNNNQLFQVLLDEHITWNTSENLKEYLHQDMSKPFGYGTPLVRLALFPNGEEGHYFVWSAQHAVYDGWSDLRVIELLSTLYHGQNVPKSLPFREFIDYVNTAQTVEAHQFWKSQLDRFQGSEFPKLPHPDYWPLAQDVVHHKINLPRIAGVNVTVATLLRAAWAIVIRQYTGSTDVCFGTVQTGRTGSLPGIANLVGPTITVAPRQSIEMIPFEHTGIQSIRTLSSDCTTACMFQSLFLVQPEPEQPRLLDGMQLLGKNDTEMPSYLLSLEITLQSGYASVVAVYDSDVLDHSEVEQILYQLEHTVHQISENLRDSALGDLGQLNPRDLERLCSWNATDLEPVQECVHWAIVRQMHSRPNAPAICYDNGKELTYGQLDRLTSALAEYLRSLGVGPESIVPFCFEKSLWAIVAVVSIPRAGGACAALEPTHPPGRLSQIIEGTNASIILASSLQLGKLEAYEKRVVCIDHAFMETISTASVNDPGPTLPSNAAFVVFTSGSTGVPKGIVLEHSSVVSTSRANGRDLELNSSSRVLQFAAFAFDVYIEDICISLMYGACICVLAEQDRLDNLPQAIKSMKVTWADLTPSVVRMIEPEQVPDLQTLVLGGELLTEEVIDRWAGKVHLFNTYGPAECTIFSTVTAALDKKAHGVNIGRPVGCHIWITDQNNLQQLLPVGSVGEMIIEGPNVARGYLNDPVKTRESFVEDLAWANRGPQGRRFYRTGDLGRFRGDGTLEIFGRKDSQVKFHGQRFELGEIEHHAAVHSAEDATIAVELVHFENRTSALLVSFQGIRKHVRSVQDEDWKTNALLPPTLQTKYNSLDLQKQLSKSLPSYMVPTVYISLLFMPITPSGKVDRKSLQRLVKSLSPSQFNDYSLASVQKDKPAQANEILLQGLWAEVIGIEQDSIGVNDSFFRVGGDSISAMRLVKALQPLGWQLSVSDIFRHPILFDMTTELKQVAEQASVVAAAVHAREVVDDVYQHWGIDPDSIQDIYPCTPLQKDMIYLTKAHRVANTLHQVFHLSAQVDIPRFQAAWTQVVANHPIFRTRIVTGRDGDLLQVVLNRPLEWETAESLADYSASLKTFSFDFGKPLVRLVLISDPEDSRGHYFVWSAHHSTYDGWSIPRTLGLVSRLYRNKSFSHLYQPFRPLVEYIEGSKSDESRSFWKTALRGSSVSSIIFPALPQEDYRPLTTDIAEHEISVLSRSASDITMASIIQGALALVIGSRTQKRDLTFGLIKTGRIGIPVPDIEDIAGPAITLVPARIRWEENTYCTPGDPTSMRAFLLDIQAHHSESLPHDHIGCHEIATLDNDCHHACSFQTLLIIQPPRADHSIIDGVTTMTSIGRELLNYGLSIECRLGHSHIFLHADFDPAVLPKSTVISILHELGNTISWLSSDTSYTKVRNGAIELNSVGVSC
ncbi:amino acid adenylation [Xylona heveae TC161]|uniref:Amino acid adenylation n=1 Tax=Xylona heveae (strain CBS 132557 / TC161) TaxID=1328760 RepID=A0A165G4W6_XYLHT|nr:amino acid adenylation [Xylona heveae TC161]KZF21742.1 amino acid adenylation [Xylona heveae TC161]